MDLASCEQRVAGFVTDYRHAFALSIIYLIVLFCVFFFIVTLPFLLLLAVAVFMDCCFSFLIKKNHVAFDFVNLLVPFDFTLLIL